MPFYRNDRADNWDTFERHSIGTELKFVVWPRRCRISNKLIWLEKAYKKTAMWTGPGDHIFEHRWYKKDEYLIAKLKGGI